MIELEFCLFLIRGLMLGIEFPEKEARPDDCVGSMVIDLGIFRLMFNFWKVEE